MKWKILYQRLRNLNDWGLLNHSIIVMITLRPPPPNSRVKPNINMSGCDNLFILLIYIFNEFYSSVQSSMKHKFIIRNSFWRENEVWKCISYQLSSLSLSPSPNQKSLSKDLDLGWCYNHRPPTTTTTYHQKLFKEDKMEVSSSNQKSSG